MNELPDWTDYVGGEEDHRGLDPLGLEALGAGIVRRLLLPGITNTTRHVRYYSFFSWLFSQLVDSDPACFRQSIYPDCLRSTHQSHD